MIIKNKVLAYIFRTNCKTRELLVFDHRNDPEVNPQVPAGTVEQNENYKQAVIREVFEESGLKLNVPPTYLGHHDYHRKDLAQLHKRHVYMFNLDSKVPNKWEHIVSDGEEDKGLIFDYCWIPVEEAREQLVGSMGDYLPKYFFEKLKKTDFLHIKKWLKQPHVNEFWDSGDNWDEAYEKHIFNISSDIVNQYIIYFQNTPIGYIQYYWASKAGDGWWEGYPDDIVGIDQYIGELDYIGKGHGTKMINEFINILSCNHNISKIITDPSPDNPRAIRCYEKCGFKQIGEINTPDGKEILMEYEIHD